jgi:hypothetical protein
MQQSKVQQSKVHRGGESIDAHGLSTRTSTCPICDRLDGERGGYKDGGTASFPPDCMCVE